MERALSTTLTVTAADDYGNNAATAAVIGVPGSLQGAIGVIGDVDWFQFQAVAGKAYVLGTQLGTLKDAILCLYDRNGTTLLARNDNSGGNLAAPITWTAPASGTYYLAVAANGNTYTGTYGVSIQTQNSAPVLTPIADQTMSSTQTTLSIAIGATDRDGDRLTYSAQVSAIDPLAQKAYTLDQQLKLSQYGGSYSTNLLGAEEKYLRGANGTWYFILPNGGLYRWGGTIARSTLIYTFNSAYYANPALLWNAQPASMTTLGSGSVSVSLSGNTLTITRAAGYTSNFYVSVSVSDGLATATEGFYVSVLSSSSMRTASLGDEAGASTAYVGLPAAQPELPGGSAATPDPFVVRNAAAWQLNMSASEAARLDAATLLERPSVTAAAAGLRAFAEAGNCQRDASLPASGNTLDGVLATLADGLQNPTLPWHSDSQPGDVTASLASARLSIPALDSLLAQPDAEIYEPWEASW